MPIPQLKDTLFVDDDGNISWEAYYLNHDPSLYFPGKKLTHEEFNKLVTQSAAQTNYLTTTLKSLLSNKLEGVVSRKVTDLFDLKQSFFKTFDAADWGTKQSDGYYYITITPQEHGYPADAEERVEPNIDTELYLLDPDGSGCFYEVSQIYTLAHNVVVLYTDVPCLGYVTIRSNMRATEYKADKVDATNVVGLHNVAITGNYADLNNTPNLDKIQENTQRINQILDGTQTVQDARNAYYARRATVINDNDTLGIPAQLGRYLLSDLFETIGPIAKQATQAHTLNYYKVFETTVQAKNPSLPDVSAPMSVNLEPNTLYTISVSRRDISNMTPSRAHLDTFLFQTRAELSEGVLHTLPYFHDATHTVQYALQIKPRTSDYSEVFDITLFRVSGNLFEDVREIYLETEEWCSWDITINKIPLVQKEE